MVYDPQGAIKRNLKRDIIDMIGKDYPKFTVPKMHFFFLMPIPKSLLKSVRKDAETGLLKHLKKPDVDNLVKFYMDVLTEITYVDDGCVEIGRAVKVYSITPGVLIYIEEVIPMLSELDLNTSMFLEAV